MDLMQLVDAIKAHGWPVVAAFVVGFLVRLIKDDKFTLIPTPDPKYRPWIALGLGVVSGVCEAVLAGTPWQQALLGGFASAITAITGHNLLIESLRGGKEVDLKAGGGGVVGILLAILALANAGCGGQMNPCVQLYDLSKTAEEIREADKLCGALVEGGVGGEGGAAASSSASTSSASTSSASSASAGGAGGAP